MEETNSRIRDALSEEESRAELIASRIRLLLLSVFTLIALANIGVVDTVSSAINFSALLAGYSYGLTVYFNMRRSGYRPQMKYVSTLLDVTLVHLVLFLYTFRDEPSVALKNYVFMIIFPIIALTIFRYDVKFTLLTGGFALLLYLMLSGYLLLSGLVTVGQGYSSELFSKNVTVVGQLTKIFILCGFVMIAAYLARYTRGLIVKLVSNETTLQVEKESIQRELQLAGEVQSRLVPRIFPTVKGLQVFGTVLPGRFVGGDYVDVLKRSESSVIMAVADVAGHGVPAALIMSQVRASLHLLVTSGYGLMDITTRINSLLIESTSQKDYVTFFLAEIDAKRNRIRYVNAGHPPPVLVSGKKITPLSGRTVGLGLVRHLPNARTYGVPFRSDDLLLCYTDGITERMNRARDQYGEHRLHAFIRSHRALDSRNFATALIEEIMNFGERNELDDDITAAVIRKI